MFKFTASKVNMLVTLIGQVKVKKSIAVFVAAGLLAGCIDNSSSEPSKAKTSTSIAANAAPVSENWRYQSDMDELRDKKAYYAHTNSINTVQHKDLGEIYSQLSLRKSSKPGAGDAVIFLLSQGSFECNEYDECSVPMRFDNSPIQTYRLLVTANDPGAIFIPIDYLQFVHKLKISKKLVIEVNISGKGATQFKFNVSNLKWDHF